LHPVLNRRAFLNQQSMGLGTLALAWLLQADSAQAKPKNLPIRRGKIALFNLLEDKGHVFHGHQSTTKLPGNPPESGSGSHEMSIAVRKGTTFTASKEPVRWLQNATCGRGLAVRVVGNAPKVAVAIPDFLAPSPGALVLPERKPWFTKPRFGRLI
jgi:hypothetical protein